MSIKKSRTFIIGISGGSGSGKTSFIKDLKINFTDEEMCFLSQDEYYKPRESQSRDENGVCNFDLPDSIDQDEFYFDLVKLMNGLEVQKEKYTFNNSKANPEILGFKPAPIIIVEGLFVFQNLRVYDLLDLKILLHASDTQKIIRRIKRDRVERNYPLEDVLYRYENHVLPSFESFIQPYFNKVDIIINNNKSYHNGKEMLISFLHTKLENGKTFQTLQGEHG